MERSSASREARIVWQLRLGEVAVDVDFRRRFEVEGEGVGIGVVDVGVVAVESLGIKCSEIGYLVGNILIMPFDDDPSPSPPRRSRQFASAGDKTQV